ncbi:hypothetical protein ABFS82_04G110500 [Erythranthe guttata]|uniref:sister chromatid cohesion protein PDS5 homolog B-like isoform X1 n=2 Tax=Erythranthe guttata TaxID=4155 RepID=UPI00064DED78|nr:PREDICTED: sister chromatid cohesion protein PDS5 homolog B-like isoform X1 [Erythranthe guttata]|eukprot:XP_012852692.1 PREDICTED: sister chromatid cohesion protein PDS5 homolog B-like isoform X1 [Erythranthe guttata]
MGASANADVVLREIEDELIVAGTNLLKLRFSSSCDEVIARLLRAEAILKRVGQVKGSPMLMKKALFPIMTALIKDKLLKHRDENVQVIVASCLNQATRITAPQQPYMDDQMRDMFGLFMVVLRGQLSRLTGDNYDRAVKILHFMGLGRTVLIMMDLDIDQMIVDMFQFFFDTISPNYPPVIFQYMEDVMTLVIEESDEVSLELLTPLLDSVRMDNKNVSPVSWELGKAVFEKCSTKLQPYLKEAVKKMNLEVSDYAEIVVSLCTTENMLEEKTASAPSEAEQAGPTSQVNDGEVVQLEMDIGVHRRRRARKPNSLMRPEEGYEHIWRIGDENSSKVSRDSAEEANTGKRGRSKMNRGSNAEYEDEIVDARVKVWWPMDKAFYTGTVEAFDPLSKKHKIVYDDDEEEVLNLSEERWEFFKERQPHRVQSAENHAPESLPRTRKRKRRERLVRRGNDSLPHHREGGK